MWPTLGFSLIIAAVYVLVELGVYLKWANVPASDDPYLNGSLLAAVSIIAGVLCSLLILLFSKLRKSLSVKDYLGLHFIPRKDFLFWAMVFMGFGAIWNALAYFLGRPIVPEVMVEIYQSTSCIALLWVALIVTAPVFEELFFRGFLFKGIQGSRLGSVGAVVITSFSWAIVHRQYGWYEVVSIMILGGLLGFVRVRTNSVWMTIAAHMMLNLVATFETRFYAGL